MGKTIDAYCEDCIYFIKHNRASPHCDYIGYTGHKRGCPPGTGYTKRQVIRRRGQK